MCSRMNGWIERKKRDLYHHSKRLAPPMAVYNVLNWNQSFKSSFSSQARSSHHHICSIVPRRHDVWTCSATALYLLFFSSWGSHKIPSFFVHNIKKIPYEYKLKMNENWIYAWPHHYQNFLIFVELRFLFSEDKYFILVFFSRKGIKLSINKYNSVHNWQQQYLHCAWI